jgi:hypothetical protein
MSELRDVMDGVVADLAAVRWPSSDELRRRVRRRRARTFTAATAAVLAVSVGVVVAGLAGFRTEPSPPAAGPSPSAPVPVEIPRSVLLQAADVGPDLDSQYRDPKDSKPFLSEFALCDKAKPLSREPLFGIDVSHLTGTTQNRSDMPFVLGQTVYRFGGADADGVMNDVRSAVAACGTQATTGPGQNGTLFNVRRIWSISDNGFTGDDALVVREEVASREAKAGRPWHGPSTSQVAAYVRTGDLVTRVSMKQGTPLTELRRFAALAGTRLCAAAQPKC